MTIRFLFLPLLLSSCATAGSTPPLLFDEPLEFNIEQVANQAAPEVVVQQEQVSDLMYDLVGLDWYLYDREQAKKEKLSWKQPDLSLYKSEPWSHLPHAPSMEEQMMRQMVKAKDLDEPVVLPRRTVDESPDTPWESPGVGSEPIPGPTIPLPTEME
jgi:hypothetical protein